MIMSSFAAPIRPAPVTAVAPARAAAQPVVRPIAPVPMIQPTVHPMQRFQPLFPHPLHPAPSPRARLMRPVIQPAGTHLPWWQRHRRRRPIVTAFPFPQPPEPVDMPYPYPYPYPEPAPSATAPAPSLPPAEAASVPGADTTAAPIDQGMPDGGDGGGGHGHHGGSGIGMWFKDHLLVVGLGAGALGLGAWWMHKRKSK
jgi:hypothetical protein